MINNQKVGAILQARMGSTRMPGKVFKNLIGKPMLSHIIERLKFCKTLDKVIVATTNLSQDSQIAKLAQKDEVIGFRGDCPENDVLTRYIQAARKYNIDVIVRVTADCPLIDPKLIDNLVEKFFRVKADYVLNCLKKTFPHGVDAEVFYTKALVKSSELSQKIEEREHVVIPMRNHPEIFKIVNIEAKSGLRRPDIRITVDYPEDFQLVEEIYKALYEPQRSYFSTLKVINFLDNHPELKKINEKYKNC